MPLIHGSSRADVSQNIREMITSGHPRAQAIAAALSTADRYGKRRASGGGATFDPSSTPPGPQNVLYPNNLPSGLSGLTVNPNTTPGGVPWANIGRRSIGNVAAPNTAPAATPATTAPPAIAPRAPIYRAPDLAASGINRAGFMPVPQTGSYHLDTNTGALSPSTQQTLQSFAMRGLPPPTGYPTPQQPAPAASSAGPNLSPSQSFLQTQYAANPAANPQGNAINPLGNPQLSDGTPNPEFNPTFSPLSGGPTAGGGGGMKRGGRLATGGQPPSMPWFVRSEARGMDHPSGLVHGIGPGRTDTVPLSVAAGSHVIPADVVAGLGQGNTLAGAHALGMAMRTGPGGISLPAGPHRATLPKPPRMPHLANGGEPQFEGHAIKLARGGVPESQGGVKCIVAGGEWVMNPDEVQRVVHAGKKGHDAVDAWILERRANDVKKLKSLPGPVKG